MVTVGIDYAAQPENTAACRGVWESGKATVEKPFLNVNNGHLVHLSLDVDKVGVDVPFGWPIKFIQFISSHNDGANPPEVKGEDFRLRSTDKYVWEKTGRQPLSVSSDRIAITAFQAATCLIPALASGYPDRKGEGKVIEVYPAAALRRWGFKSISKGQTSALCSDFLAKCDGWLQIPAEAEQAFHTNRDAFDALIAAMVARASAKNLCEPIPPEHLEAASKEGWIALPKEGSLETLAV